MGRRILVAAAVLTVAVIALGGMAQAQSKLDISGRAYTKWLWGNLRQQGALYNYTNVPGEGYGDNGQGTEIEVFFHANVSRYVEVNARLHSRFNQNFWTNFGGWGYPKGGGPPNPDDCLSGNCGEFDPRSNQYVKLRGLTVTLRPGYGWLDQVSVGASDLGQFDPLVVGKIRYIDRDNAEGVFFQGAFANRKLSYDIARISLPRLWAGPGFNTGTFHASDAAYTTQIKFVPSSLWDVTGIWNYVNDIEVDPNDTNFDNGLNVEQRYKNSVLGLRVGVHPSQVLDFRGSYYHAVSTTNSLFVSPPGFGGFSPVVTGNNKDNAWRLDADINDPFGIGLSFRLQGFFIGSDYVSVLAARRESDVLLTEGHDGTFALNDPSNGTYGKYTGNQTRIGWGGWDGTTDQVATINVDNAFTDFDEPLAETAIGWKGVTFEPVLTRGALSLQGEYTYLNYDTNWQAWGEPSKSIFDTKYPTMEGVTGILSFRSAYQPFQDRKTHIAVLNAKYTLPVAKGVDLFGKVKYIKDEDKRMNDARFLPYESGACPGGGLPCDETMRNFYSNDFTTADLYSAPPLFTNSLGQTGYAWKPFDSLSDDDRDMKYWSYQAGAGYQFTDEFYAALRYEYYDVDLVDGNSAFQAYNNHILASGKYKKDRLGLRASYNLGGAEFGFMYEYIWGSFEPNYGTPGVDYIPFYIDGKPYLITRGSLNGEGGFNPWINPMAAFKRDFDQQRIKAYLKVAF